MAETQIAPIAVITPDGRRLAVHEAGDPGGRPVVCHHGSPSAGLFTQETSALARERGLRLIGYDRPGYGGSDRDRGRMIAGAAADVVAICDALGVERFVTWGSSGGGPHALACASLLGPRCVAAICSSSVAPPGAEGLDWLAGMGEGNVAEFLAAQQGEEALLAHLAEGPGELAVARAEDVLPVIRSVLCPVDASVMTLQLAENWVTVLRHALAPGAGGWVDDDLACIKDWGFDPCSPRPGGVPVEIWHGHHDMMVPVAHGQWLADHVPGAAKVFFQDDGHLSLFERRMPLIYDAIARYTF